MGEILAWISDSELFCSVPGANSLKGIVLLEFDRSTPWSRGTSPPLAPACTTRAQLQRAPRSIDACLAKQIDQRNSCERSRIACVLHEVRVVAFSAANSHTVESRHTAK